MRFTAFTCFAGSLMLMNSSTRAQTRTMEQPLLLTSTTTTETKEDTSVKTSISTKDQQTLDEIVIGETALNPQMKFFVRYRNSYGEEYAIKRAIDEKVDSFASEQNLLVLKAANNTALKEMMESKEIAYVEPVHEIHALPTVGATSTYTTTTTSTEPVKRRLAETTGYGITMVQADQMWGLPPQPPITVCVIDSGYAIGHPDLPDLTDGVTGFSPFTEDWDTDTNGHGTHCAGIIGEIGNSQGYVGVMKDPSSLNLHIAKSIDSGGTGTEADLLAALASCTANGAKVVSMSLGSEASSLTLRVAFENAYNNGMLLVSASGNDGDITYNYPASYPQVISVGAVDSNMDAASFTQINYQVEIAAPGVAIDSTAAPTGYSTESGTSMSTPFVAGVAAQVWAHFPTCTNNQIRNVLLRTALDPTGVGCNPQLGYGIVQAKDAYDLLAANGCTAGDSSPAPLSDLGIGGCYQDPNYVCARNEFKIELDTDQFGGETTWELYSITYQINVAFGSGYDGHSSYVEKFCLPWGQYKFSIMDAYGDGMCCSWGQGNYNIYYQNNLVASGGQFGMDEHTIFGCEDDDTWIHIRNGQEKTCSWVSSKPTNWRCTRLGEPNEFGVQLQADEACPVACSTCA